jgi:hypothetical protein
MNGHDVIIRFARILLISETVARRQKVTIDHYYKVGVGLSESVLKKDKKTPPSGEINVTSYLVCSNPDYPETVADSRKVSLEQ